MNSLRHLTTGSIDNVIWHQMEIRRKGSDTKWFFMNIAQETSSYEQQAAAQKRLETILKWETILNEWKSPSSSIITWMRWLLGSATTMSSSIPRQKPCGELNWPWAAPSWPKRTRVCIDVYFTPMLQRMLSAVVFPWVVDRQVNKTSIRMKKVGSNRICSKALLSSVHSFSKTISRVAYQSRRNQFKRCLVTDSKTQCNIPRLKWPLSPKTPMF